MNVGIHSFLRGETFHTHKKKTHLRIYPINCSFSPCVMHNGDRDGFPERSGLVNCGHWMMPMLWSGGRADKISNKLAGDIACLGGSMVEHQPRLLGFRVRFPAGAFAIFSVSAKASLPFSLSLSAFPPLPFPSSSFPFPSPFDLSFALKKRIFAFIPFHTKKTAKNCLIKNFLCKNIFHRRKNSGGKNDNFWKVYEPQTTKKQKFIS